MPPRNLPRWAIVAACGALLLCLALLPCARAQNAAAPSPSPDIAAINRGSTPPNYPAPYEPATPEKIAPVLERIRQYLETASAIRVIDPTTNQPVEDLSHLPERVALGRSDFAIVSYEWGVTYSGMLLAAEATSDARYKDFVARRMDAIARLTAHLRAQPSLNPRDVRPPLRGLLGAHSLDETGAMGAAMIKALQAGAGGDRSENLRAQIDYNVGYVHTGQMRLADGTLARNIPLPHTLWLDDLYMSVPALAQMGKLTGDRQYYDDAVKQVLQFSQRMFVKEKGLYMHGWVEGMQEHSRFHWARANGWALLAMTELLSVLPEDHPGYGVVLAQFRELARGIAACQGINGMWHQLLDRSETYEETSATAIYVFCYARAINRGWLDPLAYGPVASLGWNAAAQKVNAQGQVEGTCVGTGMGWDTMFYAYRPVSVYAAHGYGPMLLAGAEMMTLRRGKGAQMSVHDGGVQFAPAPPREN